MKLLGKNMFERLTSQRLVTITEVVNALYGINPNTKTKQLPPEISEEAQDIRKAILRNISTLSERKISISEELDADYVFGASYQFLSKGITPEEVIARVDEAIRALLNSNGWENKMLAFGGRSLVEEMSKSRKSGRGAHRVNDEQKSTDKTLALLIMLLTEKHPSKKYGSPKKPKISEIYSDLESMANTWNISDKGIKKSTFYNKIKFALSSVSSNDD